MDSENCLYLNVFAPRAEGWGGQRRGGLPVLVMIHGGGLTTGAGDQHDGSLIVRTDHIIVVSINYRLGPFGSGLLKRAADVAAAWRPDPHHHGCHLRRRAQVRVLERRGR